MSDNTNAPTTIEFNGVACDILALLPDSVSKKAQGELVTSKLWYLIKYGYNKSLQDAVAGQVKLWTELHDRVSAQAYPMGDAGAKDRASDEKAFSKVCDVAGFTPGAALDMAPETFAKAIAKATQEARRDSILDGTAGTTSKGPRLTPMEKTMRDVADDIIKQFLAGKKCRADQIAGFTDLKPESAFKALVDRYLDKNWNAVEAEATRRMEAAKSFGSGELNI